MKTSEFIVRIEHPDHVSAKVIEAVVFAAVSRTVVMRSVPNAEHALSINVKTHQPKTKGAK
jgi:hypothetical protein